MNKSKVKITKNSLGRRRNTSPIPNFSTLNPNGLHHNKLWEDLETGKSVTTYMPSCSNTQRLSLGNSEPCVQHAPALIILAQKGLLLMRNLALCSFLTPSTVKADGGALGAGGDKILKFPIKLT